MSLFADMTIIVKTNKAMRLEITITLKDNAEARLFEDACRSADIYFVPLLDDLNSYAVVASDAMHFYFLGIYVGLAKAQKTLETK